MDTDRHSQTQTDTDRHRPTQTDTDRHSQSRTDRGRHRQTDRHRQTLLAAGLVWCKGYAALGSHTGDLAQGVAAPARLRACAGGAQALKVRVVFAMFDRGRGLADASAELTRRERISMCTVPMLVCFALACASSNATES